MVEILFGESEAESLKVAKPRSEAKHVICLDFMLDIGDIREAADSGCRRSLICSLYEPDTGNHRHGEDASQRMAERWGAELSRLEDFLQAGEPVRVWYSDSAYARCGLYELCSRLSRRGNKVCAVNLPEYRRQGQVITIHNSWRSVSAEEFAQFLPCGTELTEPEIRMFAQSWGELVEDNSPLRAMINGKLTGVPEDFYDFLIWKRLGQEPVKEGHLIGDLVGYYRLDIGDWWFAARLQHYIETGKIRVTQDADRPYQRMICLA